MALAVMAEKETVSGVENSMPGARPGLSASEVGQGKMINSYRSLASASERQEGLVGTGACALTEAECGLLGMGAQCHRTFRSSDVLRGAIDFLRTIYRFLNVDSIQ